MIKFTKLSATGNDFILIDNRDENLTGEEHAFFQQICQRRLGVGADGILLIGNSELYHFSLTYYNSDGYIGEVGFPEAAQGPAFSGAVGLPFTVDEAAHVIVDIAGHPDVPGGAADLQNPPHLALPHHVGLDP